MEYAMSTKSNKAISKVAVIGIDIGKNTFHVVGQDERESHRFISLDPNVRLTVLDDPAIWRDRIERLLPFVDLVKVSQEDILLLFPNSSPEVVARGWLKAGPSVVVVTNGAKSVHAFRPNSDIEAAPPVVDVVDTVGAGDAFQAVLLTCLMHPADGIVPVASISDAALRTALNQATQASAETCRRRGADIPMRATGH
jgi:fructokinase